MPAHTVILRRYSEEDESDKYYPIDTVGSVTAANKLALKTSGEPGDILIVCDTAYVSDLPKYAKNIFVINKQGECVKARKVPQDLAAFNKKRNWLDVWEGNEFDLSIMSYIVYYKIGITAIKEIMIEYTRLAITYATDREVIYLSSRIIKVVEDFYPEMTTALKVLQDSTKMIDIKSGSTDSRILATVNSSADTAIYKDAYFYASATTECSRVIGREQIAEIIRKHVPLRRILLAPSV